MTRPMDRKQLATEVGVPVAFVTRCIDTKALIPDEIRDFKKWGQHLQTPLFFHERLEEHRANLITLYGEEKQKAAEARKTRAKASSAKAAETRKRLKEIKDQIDVGRYETFFPVARSLERVFEFRLGPTNSGKTHHAMEELAKAESGVYLAPLRLMALENYDRLKAMGVPATMLTGEEQFIDPNASHTASTIEMMSEDRVVDVAVIDEIQMIFDRDRGWAWVRALFGVPAKRVIVCGSEDALIVLQRLLDITGEEFETHIHQRRSRLISRQGSAMKDKLTKGDAIVVFSRRDVFEWRDRLVGDGHKVSVIYGALSPEVRRSQAEMFSNGTTDILVATDAIGMGLNLPIKRVFIDAETKFDGKSTRQLTQQEIKQICGRAGRGTEDGYGFVPTKAMKKTLSAPSTFSFKGRLGIMPSWSAIKALSRALGTEELAELMKQAMRRMNSDVFETRITAEIIEFCKFLDDLSLDLRTKFDMIGLPFDKWTKTLIFDFVRDHVDGEVGCIRCADPQITDEEDLQQVENKIKIFTAYRWLSYRWPDIYVDQETAIDNLKRLNNASNEWLMKAKQSSSNRCDSCGCRLPARFRFDYCGDCWEDLREIRRGW